MFDRILCQTADCWDATGSMLAGLGALIAAGAVIWVARKGRDAVADWRLQKQDERRIAAAEMGLTAAYRARSALEGLRAPFMSAYELDRASKQLIEQGVDLATQLEGRQSRLELFQGLLNRAKDRQPEWDALFDAMPVVAAFFGPEVEAEFRKLARQRNVVLTAAEMYVDLDDSDRDFSRRIRGEIWGHDDTDEVSVAIKGAIEAIEAQLLPVLRGGHVEGPPAPP